MKLFSGEGWFCAGALVLGVLLLAGPAGAQNVYYGLESVQFRGIHDPDARAEPLRVVSGSLKLTGRITDNPRVANSWKTLTYIPQRTAAPKSDYGIFRVVGDQVRFLSFISNSVYVGQVLENGERVRIQKVNRSGQMQVEVWYLKRGRPGR